MHEINDGTHAQRHELRTLSIEWAMISLNSSIGLFVPACHALLEDVIVEACEVESGEIHIRHDARAYASTVMILRIGHETA